MALNLFSTGATFLIAALLCVVAYLGRKINKIEVEGKIVRTTLRQFESSGQRKPNKRPYYPVVAFELNGALHEVELYIGYKNPPFQEGEVVKLLCAAENVRHVIVERHHQKILIKAALILGLVGVAMVVLGFMLR